MLLSGAGKRGERAGLHALVGCRKRGQRVALHALVGCRIKRGPCRRACERENGIEGECARTYDVIQHSLLRLRIERTRYIARIKKYRLRIETTRYTAGITNTQNTDYGLKACDTVVIKL